MTNKQLKARKPVFENLIHQNKDWNVGCDSYEEAQTVLWKPNPPKQGLKPGIQPTANRLCLYFENLIHQNKDWNYG